MTERSLLRTDSIMDFQPTWKQVNDVLDNRVRLSGMLLTDQVRHDDEARKEKQGGDASA